MTAGFPLEMALLMEPRCGGRQTTIPVSHNGTSGILCGKISHLGGVAEREKDKKMPEPQDIDFTMDFYTKS
jgi:hypothetical protein